MLVVMNLNAANYDDHNRPYNPGNPRPEPGLWADRLPLIVQAIVDHSPDVIGLCEIRFNPDNPFNATCECFWQQQGVAVSDCAAMDMGKQIMTLLQARSPAYAEAGMITDQGMTYAGGIWEGQSIISRFPIADHGVIDHGEGPGDGNRRITQWAELTTPEGALWIYNAHLSTARDFAAQNAAQVIADMRQRLGDFDAASACVIGDMNTEPDMQAMQAFTQAGLSDLWAAVGTGDGFTFQSWHPVKRIDYCWATGALAPAVTGIVQIGTTLQPPVGGSFLSDHSGLVTSFM